MTANKKRGQEIVFGLMLVLLIALAYAPAFTAGFIWDDDAYVTDNAMLTAPGGLKAIWFSTHRQSQYFPLTYTTLWFERALWGLNPMGYHAVNVFLHALNALLLWQLLKRLAVPGAWLAAAIFALHPVQVESVAWVTELKNVQSTLFYLLTVLVWLKFTGKQTTQPWRFYLLALLLYALALFSKTTACTLPAALLLVLWWRREAIGWRRIFQVVPFVLMGLAMGLVSVWWEKHLGNYEQDAGVAFSFAERTLVATRAVWFYAGKIFWPVGLSFSYPRWQVDTRSLWQYAGLAGCVVVALLAWWRRKNLGRGAMAGVVFFVAALSPLLGFIPLYTFRYSFVADHYQYLACAGLIIPFAALVSGRTAKERLGSFFHGGLVAVLLLALAILTWRQCGIYKDVETLWRDTLAKNPASSLAHNNLAYELYARGEMTDAIRHYRQALQFKPDYPEALGGLGTALSQLGGYAAALPYFEAALKLRRDDPDVHKNFGSALANLGRMDEAIAHFQEAIRLKPTDAGTHYNLANALVLRKRFDEAVTTYHEALRLAPDSADARRNLGLLLAQLGRRDEAVAHLKEALRLRPADVEAREQLRALGVSVFIP